MSAQYYEGIGRRKEASARVRLFPGGTGKFTVNDKSLEEYMPRIGDMEVLLQPFAAVGQEQAQ